MFLATLWKRPGSLAKDGTAVMKRRRKQGDMVALYFCICIYIYMDNNSGEISVVALPDREGHTTPCVNIYDCDISIMDL